MLGELPSICTETPRWIQITRLSLDSCVSNKLIIIFHVLTSKDKQHVPQLSMGEAKDNGHH